MMCYTLHMMHQDSLESKRIVEIEPCVHWQGPSAGALGPCQSTGNHILF